MTIKYISFFLLGFVLNSCTRESGETVVYGKVVDEKGQPAAQIPVFVSGHKKRTLSSSKQFAIDYTDNRGKYRILFTPDERYNSFVAMINSNLGYPMSSKFDYGLCQSNELACPIAVGATNEHNFTLVSK